MIPKTTFCIPAPKESSCARRSTLQPRVLAREREVGTARRRRDVQDFGFSCDAKPSSDQNRKDRRFELRHPLYDTHNQDHFHPDATRYLPLLSHQEANR